MAIDKYSFGVLLFVVNREYFKFIRNLDSKVGLFPGQDRIITVIKDYPGCTLSELSDRCNIGKPSLSVSINSLINSGYVIRRPKTGLTRKHYLTDEGLEKAIVFHQAVDKFFSELLEELGDNAEAFESGMQTFLKLLHTYSPPAESDTALED